MRSNRKPKSKKNKTKGKVKTTKKGVEQPPKKKVGRPSNAELAERAKVKRHEHDAVREQLLAAMEANVSPQTNTGPVTLTVQPKYPVFFIGEEVCSGWWENLYEGHVVADPDPVNGALARVKWDDGRISWHAKENLRSMHKARQRKVKRVIYGDQQRSTRNLEGTSSIE